MGTAVVDNDLYVMAGYTGNGADGYLSDAWSLRLLDEAAACQPADFGGSERWALIGRSFELGPLCAHCAITTPCQRDAGAQRRRQSATHAME